MELIRLSAQFVVVDENGNEYKISEFICTGKGNSPEEQVTYFLENGLEAIKISPLKFRVKQTSKYLRKNP